MVTMRISWYSVDVTWISNQYFLTCIDKHFESSEDPRNRYGENFVIALNEERQPVMLSYRFDYQYRSEDLDQISAYQYHQDYFKQKRRRGVGSNKYSFLSAHPQ